MKHILFILTSFQHGGTNKSLENLLSLIDTSKFRVDVFAMEHSGPYKDMLPNCNVLPENKWLSALIARYGDTNGVARIRSLFVKLLRNLYLKLNCSIADKLYRKTVNNLLIGKKYDAVIAYSEGVPTAFVSHLSHPNKIAWVHCDYSSYMNLNNQPDETEIYRTYKSIVCVSEYTKNVFVRIIPEMGKKTHFIHNLLNVNEIKRKSDETLTDDKFNSDCFTLITIGSFYPIKRLSYIPGIANELKKRGCDFRWFVIANINNIDEFKRFENLILEYRISDSVIYLGEKTNPYPYLKKSDLLVTLSLTEACPYVVNESIALHIPIICSDFPSASEFVENGNIGYIVPIDNVADKIELLINDKSIHQGLKSNVLLKAFDSKLLMDQLYNILNI